MGIEGRSKSLGKLSFLVNGSCLVIRQVKKVWLNDFIYCSLVNLDLGWGSNRRASVNKPQGIRSEPDLHTPGGTSASTKPLSWLFLYGFYCTPICFVPPTHQSTLFSIPSEGTGDPMLSVSTAYLLLAVSFAYPWAIPKGKGSLSSAYPTMGILPIPRTLYRTNDGHTNYTDWEH